MRRERPTSRWVSDTYGTFTSAHGSLRFSLSRYTTEEEIDYTLSVMPPIVARLRELSPFVTKVK